MPISLKFWYVASDILCELYVRFDVYLSADNTKMKLIYASVAAKFSPHFVIWQPFWIFIITISYQWSCNVFEQTPGVP